MPSNFRKKLIRLAHANPDLRPHLMPLLKEAAPISGYAYYAREMQKFEQHIQKATDIIEDVVQDLDYDTSLSLVLKSLQRVQSDVRDWLHDAARGRVASRSQHIRDDVVKMHREIQDILELVKDKYDALRRDLDGMDKTRWIQTIKYLSDARSALFEAQDWMKTINPEYR